MHDKETRQYSEAELAHEEIGRLMARLDAYHSVMMGTLQRLELQSSQWARDEAAVLRRWLGLDTQKKNDSISNDLKEGGR